MKKEKNVVGNNAVLVSLNIRTWSANVIDSNVSQKVATEHGTDQKLGRFWKTLLPKTKGSPLALIYAIEREARTFHYANTLPFMHDGIRILTTANYMPYMDKIRELRSRMEKEVAMFLNDYELAKAQAQAELKTLFREEDYPTRDGVARKFSLAVDVLPMPKTDAFEGTELPDQDVAQVKQDLERELALTFQRANEDLWTRLYGCVQQMHTRLSGDPAFLRESAVDSAKELLGLLPRLNVTNDERLEEMRSKLDTAFAGVSASALRQDTVLRNQAVDEVAAIEKMMAGFMGGAPAKLELKNAA